MIRISDIIKMASQNGPPPENKKDKNESFVSEKIQKKDAPSETKQLYDQGTELIKGIFDRLKLVKDINSQQAQEYITNAINFQVIINYVNRLVDYILIGDGEMFGYFYTHNTETSYLPRHSLNVCILSIKIGTWLDMNKSDLINIALGAMLHDIGLAAIEDIILLPRKLKGKERQRVKRHSVHSANILEKVKELTSDIVTAVKNHHKRLTDKNVTKETDNDKLQKMVQIIGLADIYEAVTHQRSYRPAKLPYEAVKELIEKEADNFQTKIMKSLIDNIGIYPIGSWVRLTNGEIGIVISTNKGYPLRPKINVIFDASGNKLTESKSVDLLEKPHLHIESPIDIEENKHLIEQIK